MICIALTIPHRTASDEAIRILIITEEIVRALAPLSTVFVTYLIAMFAFLLFDNYGGSYLIILVPFLILNFDFFEINSSVSITWTNILSKLN